MSKATAAAERKPDTVGSTYPPVDPAVEALVRDIIGKVADKWTMLILEALEEHGTLRFTQPANGTYAGAISGAGTVIKAGAGTLTLTG